MIDKYNSWWAYTDAEYTDHFIFMHHIAWLLITVTHLTIQFKNQNHFEQNEY
mgnify:CR=1 FL=1